MKPLHRIDLRKRLPPLKQTREDKFGNGYGVDAGSIRKADSCRTEIGRQQPACTGPHALNPSKIWLNRGHFERQIHGLENPESPKRIALLLRHLWA